MSYEAGSAFLQVIPSFAGVVDAISEEFSKDGDIAGTVFKESFQASVSGTTVSVGIDTAGAEAQLGILDADIDATAAKSPTVRVNVDGSAEAVGELGAVELAADGASGAGGSGGGIAGLGAAAEDSGASLGSYLLPALGILSTTLVPLAGLAAGALSTLPAILAGIGAGGAAIALAAGPIEDAVKFAFTPLLDSLRPLVDDAILPGVESGVYGLATAFEGISGNIVTAAGDIGNFAAQFGKIVSSKASIGELNTIIGAGVGFMQQLGKAALQIVPAFLTVSAQATPILTGIGSGIQNIVADFAKWVAGGGFETFVRWVQANGPAIVSDIQNIAGAFGPIVVAIAPVGLAVLNLLGDIGQLIGLAAPVIAFVGQAGSALVGFLNPIQIVKNAISNLQDLWDGVWSALSGPVTTAVGAIVGALSSIGTDIGSAMSAVAGIIEKPFVTAFHDIVSAWNSSVGGFGFSIPSWVPFLSGDSFHIPNMHTGGIVPGFPGTDVPIMMQAGELVIPRSGVMSLAAAGGSSSPAAIAAGPAMHVDYMNVQNESDVQSLGQQLAFLRGARRL